MTNGMIGISLIRLMFQSHVDTPLLFSIFKNGLNAAGTSFITATPEEMRYTVQIAVRNVLDRTSWESVTLKRALSWSDIR